MKRVRNGASLSGHEWPLEAKQARAPSHCILKGEERYPQRCQPVQQGSSPLTAFDVDLHIGWRGESVALNKVAHARHVDAGGGAFASHLNGPSVCVAVAAHASPAYVGMNPLCIYNNRNQEPRSQSRRNVASLSSTNTHRLRRTGAASSIRWVAAAGTEPTSRTVYADS